MAEYESLKKSDTYYFLLITAGQAKGEEEPMVRFLTLEKGGAEKGDNIALRTEVISLPLCPVDGGSGRELVFLPALVKGVQEFTAEAMASEKAAYSGMAWFNERFDRKGAIKRIYLAKEDISTSVSVKEREKYMDEDIILCDEDEADKAYTDKTYNTLVSYTVSAGTWSYKLLVEADTDTVYYLRKHKVKAVMRSGTAPCGLRYAVRRGGSAVGYCALSLRCGTRDEAGFGNGIAHFAEHTIFRGTARKSASVISSYLDRLGGELNAYTTKEEIVLHATVLKEDLGKAAGLLFELATEATFPDAEIETERGHLRIRPAHQAGGPPPLHPDLLRPGAHGLHGRCGPGRESDGKARAATGGETVRRDPRSSRG